MGKAPTIRVSKLNAARRQLDCAIELWFADKDQVSVHTLAAAAHQIIHDINQKKDGGELMFDSAIIKDEHRPELISILKIAMNFFKHADKDAEGIVEFAPISSIMFIVFSIIGLEMLGEITNDIEHTFFLRLALDHPTWVTAEYQEAIKEQIPIDHFDEIRNISKGEFFEMMMRLRAESRYKRRF